MKQGQYYPGMMARAQKTLVQDIKIIDLVVELLDARIPASSRNQVLAGYITSKKHLILLHKADRAEAAVTECWLSYFRNNNHQAMAFSVYEKRYLDQLLRFLKKEGNNLKSTRYKRPLRMLIAGIPNVGKSTLINYFVRKAVTRTGNQPGITRGRQWIKITPGLELLDTPGILTPQFDKDRRWLLAAVGTLPAGSVELEDIACQLIDFYLQHEKESYITARYPGLLVGKPEEMFQQIGILQGCLQAAGKIDSERTAALLLRDFQNGNLGKVTLEHPPPLDEIPN